MRNITFILLFSLFSLSCTKREELLSEKEVFAVINRFDEGWRNKNAELVDSVLSEKYLYFTQSGHIFTRSNIVSTAGSDTYELQTMERENLTMQIEGDAAVVNTIWKGKGYYHGEQFNDKQRCSITIVKHDGKDKILAENCTPIK